MYEQPYSYFIISYRRITEEEFKELEVSLRSPPRLVCGVPHLTQRLSDRTCVTLVQANHQLAVGRPPVSLQSDTEKCTVTVYSGNDDNVKMK